MPNETQHKSLPETHSPTDEDALRVALGDPHIRRLVKVAGYAALAASGETDAGGALLAFLGLPITGAGIHAAEVAIFCGSVYGAIREGAALLGTCPKCGGRETFQGLCVQCGLMPIQPGGLEIVVRHISHEKESG
jgi:hypothetical protein